MNKAQTKTTQRVRRHKRIRAKVKGTGTRPRLSVFKSNRFVYGQLINDEVGTTLASVRSATGTNHAAREAGKALGKAAKAKDVARVVFDRGGFSYLGAIREFAEGARESGLEF